MISTSQILDSDIRLRLLRKLIVRFRKKGSSPWHSRSTVEICCWAMESASEYFMFTYIIYIYKKNLIVYVRFLCFFNQTNKNWQNCCKRAPSMWLIFFTLPMHDECKAKEYKPQASYLLSLVGRFHVHIDRQGIIGISLFCNVNPLYW